MEPTRLQPECIRCLLNKYIDASPADAPRAVRTSYMQRLLTILANAPKTSSSPLLMDQIDALYEALYGSVKDYTDIKRRFNQRMLEREDDLYRRICRAEDPLRAAVQYAMTGNYIDFGALDSVTEEELSSFLDRAEDISLNEDIYHSFREDMLRMRHLVFLTDNCGEIVMDKLLLRALHDLNPRAELTAVVRGRPVLNDATAEDAEQVGLAQWARVLDNGQGIAGTWLEGLPTEVRAIVDGADAIIAKGQGNFETLNGCGLNIYYLFLCKCEMFARRFSVPKFTGILTNDRRLPRLD